jgi:plasmid maintenance system antidote protein VapI
MTSSADAARTSTKTGPYGGRTVTAYSRQRAIRIATGRWHPWADPAPVRAHVMRLRDQGASYQGIAEAAAVGVMTVHAIVNRPGRVTARTAAAVLAVRDTDVHRARLEAGGTRLRLRALQVMGHSSANVARRIGVREQVIQKITRGEARTVSPLLRDAVARIYDAWWDKRAPERTRHERSAASAARRRAIRGNWCPGAGLDEDELDIPGYQPACGWRPARGTGVAQDVTPTLRQQEELPRLWETAVDGRPPTGTRAGTKSGGGAVNATWEQKIESARAKRLALAREFAAQRGMSRRAGEHLAAAVDAEPGLNLSLIDQFRSGMREAAAAILPRGAHGPEHEPAARDHLATAARMASRGRHQEAAHWLAEAGREITRADERRMRAEQLRAVERAQAARSIECPCRAGRGVPCGPSGDHLARYLRAEQRGVITRGSLKEVIAGLDVIAPHVMIQPPRERAADAAGAVTADQILRAQIAAGIGRDRIEASAEWMLGGRPDHPTATFGVPVRGRDGSAREMPELETGA